MFYINSALHFNISHFISVQNSFIFLVHLSETASFPVHIIYYIMSYYTLRLEKTPTHIIFYIFLENF